MKQGQHSSLTIGATIVIVMVGLAFLIERLPPDPMGRVNLARYWPLIIIGAGLVLFFLSMATRTPELAMPAFIVMGIGLLVFWQNATRRWDTWSYMWTLIPGFAGVGIIVASLLGARTRAMADGGALILVSIVLYLIFGSPVGWTELLLRYWPLVAISLGLIFLMRSLLR